MRIISGSHRGRRFRVPSGVTTRPTSDRVRESLFMVLGDLRGEVVLDGFAGSGALGLEAMSRGAGGCTFIERDKGALQVLRSNIEELGFTQLSTVFKGEFLGCLRRVPGVADLVFLDPPYRSDYGSILGQLRRSAVVREGTRVVVEHDATVDPEGLGLAGYEWAETREYGSTMITLGTVCRLADPGASDPVVDAGRLGED